MADGAVIRERREARGLTLEAVSRATRIPLAHLRALEDERLDELPAGPYASAYRRAVCAYLGLDGTSVEGAPPLPATPPQGAPLWVVRAMAAASMVALALLLGSLAIERVRPSLPALPLATGSPQTLAVTARKPIHLVVRVDGAEVLDRKLAEGEKLSFEAREAIEVDVPAIAEVRLDWNGAQVVPQGRMDAPRTLRFEDDHGVTW